MANDRTKLWKRLLVASFFVGFASCLFTRKTFAVFIPLLIHDLQWRESNIGAISSSFVIGFALSQVALSTLPNRISLRWVYTVCVLGSGLINILLGLFHHSLLSFGALWLVNGFFQGFAWPSIVRMTTAWYSADERGKILGIAGVGGNLAGMMAPAVFQFLAIWFRGWRQVFVITGVCSVVISGIVAVITRGSPAEVLKNVSNDAHAHKKEQSKLSETTKRTSMKTVFTSGLFWVMCLSHLLCNFAKCVLCDWTQLYLIQDKKWDQEQAILTLGAYELGGVVGCLLVGFLADCLMKRYESMGSYARLPIVIAFSSAAMVALQLFRDAQGQHTALIVILLFIMGMCLYGPMALFVMVPTEMAPPKLEGRAYAVSELSAQTLGLYVGICVIVGGFLAGFPISLLIISYDWSTAMFAIQTTALLMSLANITLLILYNRTKQAVKVE